MGNENTRNLGFEADITVVQTHAPQVIDDATPVLSDAVDTGDYPRCRIMVIGNQKETTGTVHTMAMTVTESATSGGSYSACTVSGTLTAISADGIQWASVKRNIAKPFLKVTFTGSNADVDGIYSSCLVFINPSV